jgi:hypothetical protein
MKTRICQRSHYANNFFACLCKTVPLHDAGEHFFERLVTLLITAITHYQTDILPGYHFQSTGKQMSWKISIAAFFILIILLFNSSCRHRAGDPLQ